MPGCKDSNAEGKAEPRAPVDAREELAAEGKSGVKAAAFAKVGAGCQAQELSQVQPLRQAIRFDE